MSCPPRPEDEIKKAAAKKIAGMTMGQRQVQYSELASKVAHKTILTKEELAELIVLKDASATTPRKQVHGS